MDVHEQQPLVAFSGSASNEGNTLEKWKRRKVTLCYQKKEAYIMLTFCRGEKEERKEEQEEREKKMGRTKAVAFRRETITGKKTTRKNGKSKPGGDSLSEEGDDDYKPPTHLAWLKPREGMVVGGERRRPRRRKKQEGGAFSPKTDFYYYSGFGPLWCKKRGDGAAGNAENSIRIVVPSSASSSSSASEHDGEDSCRDEEDGVDAGDCEWKVEVRERKKRGAMRKKVKARSLKTLL